MKTNKLKTYLKFGILLFGFSFFIIACQKEDNNNESHEHQIAEINYFHINELPEVASALSSMANVASRNNNLSSNRVMNTTFGALNLTNILEYVNNDEKLTYSFLIDKDYSTETPYTFENLHLVKVQDGFLAYILKWEPNEQWLETNDFNLEIQNFTGTQTHYDLDYNVIQATEFTNGQPVNNIVGGTIYNRSSQNKSRYMEYVCVSTFGDLCEYTGDDYCAGAKCGFGIKTSCSWQEAGGSATGGSGGEGGNAGEGGNGETGGGGGTRIPRSDDDSQDVEDGDAIVVPVIPSPLDLAIDNFFNNLTDEQEECLNTTPQLSKDVRTYLVNNIGTYLQDEGTPSTNPQDFATLAMEAVCEGSEVDFVNEVILDESFVDNEKLKCVYDKLTADNSPLFRNTVGAFIDDPEFKLTFKVGNCTSTDDACTNTTDPNNIEIIIEDVNITPVEMAQLILHEAIHAEIARYVALHQTGVDVNDRPYLFELYKYYKELYDFGNIDHIYMTLNYINPINTALRAFDNFNFSADYYSSFAWDGLRFWDAGNLLSIEEDAANASRRLEVIENSSVCE